MSYFGDKGRVSTRPTKEELKVLSHHLSDRSAEELRKVIELAINDTPDIAHIFAKVIGVAGIIKPVQLQPVQQQPVIFCDEQTYQDGLLTPVDSSEDSEMSGTEGVKVPARAQWDIQSRQPSAQGFCFQSNPHFGSDSGISQRRSNKRKSLAERDENVANSRPWSTNSQSTCSMGLKKSRPAPFNMTSISHSSTTPCLNCGNSIRASEWDQPHSCVYHPGTFERYPMPSLSTGFRSHSQRGTWSCCKAGFSDRGCLASRHRDVAANGSSCVSQYGTFIKSGELIGTH